MRLGAPLSGLTHPPPLNRSPEISSRTGFYPLRHGRSGAFAAGVFDNGGRFRKVMSGVNEIRKSFLDYFAQNEHQKVSSSGRQSAMSGPLAAGGVAVLLLAVFMMVPGW